MGSTEFWIFFVLIASGLFFGGAAVMALAWGVRNGQFENFEAPAGPSSTPTSRSAASPTASPASSGRTRPPRPRI